MDARVPSIKNLFFFAAGDNRAPRKQSAVQGVNDAVSVADNLLVKDKLTKHRIAWHARAWPHETKVAAEESRQKIDALCSDENLQMSRQEGNYEVRNEDGALTVAEIINGWLFTKDDGSPSYIDLELREEDHLDQARLFTHKEAMVIGVVLANHLADILGKDGTETFSLLQNFFSDLAVTGVKPVEYLLRNAKENHVRASSPGIFNMISRTQPEAIPEIIKSIEALFIDFGKNQKELFNQNIELTNKTFEALELMLITFTMDHPREVLRSLEKILKAKSESPDDAKNQRFDSLGSTLRVLARLEDVNLGQELRDRILKNGDLSNLKDKFEAIYEGFKPSPINNLKIFFNASEPKNLNAKTLAQDFFNWFQARLDFIIENDASNPHMKEALEDFFPTEEITDVKSFRETLLNESKQKRNELPYKNINSNFFDIMTSVSHIDKGYFEDEMFADFKENKKDYGDYIFLLEQAFANQIALELKNDINPDPNFMKFLNSRMGEITMPKLLEWTVKSSRNAQRANRALALINDFRPEVSMPTMLNIMQAPLADETMVYLVAYLAGNAAKTNNPASDLLSPQMEDILNKKILDADKKIKPEHQDWFKNIATALRYIKKFTPTTNLAIYRGLENGLYGAQAQEIYNKLILQAKTPFDEQ